MKQVKLPLELTYKAYKEGSSVFDQDLSIYDFEKMQHMPLIHAAFQAFHKMIEAGDAIEPHLVTSAQKLIEFNTIEIDKEQKELFERICGILNMTADSNFAPFCAFLGGVASQEIVKFLTQKFKPIHQSAYFDVLEFLPKDFNPLDQVQLDKYLEENEANM